ncbi:adenine phosphoribosyltransferase [soil metagenome]
MPSFEAVTSMYLLEKRVKNAIRNVPDFPKPGIQFKDITPILLDVGLCKDIVQEFKHHIDFQVDAIVAIESGGFFFGTLLADRLNVPFIPIRKEGKLPGDCVKYKYDLEYGTATVELHKGFIKPGMKVLIHDDLLATGGTVTAAAELVQMEGGEVAGFSFLVNLSFLNGVKVIEKYSDKVLSIVTY